MLHWWQATTMTIEQINANAVNSTSVSRWGHVNFKLYLLLQMNNI